MGAIAKEFFRMSPALDYPLLALALFMAVFVAISVRAFMQKPARVDAVARLPLEDGSSKEFSHE